MNEGLRQIKRTNHINESECFSLPREVDIYTPQTSLVISSLLRREQNSPVRKGLITQDNFPYILSLNFDASLQRPPFGPRLTTPGNRICLQETFTSYTSAEKSRSYFTLCSGSLMQRKRYNSRFICTGCYTRQIFEP